MASKRCDSPCRLAAPVSTCALLRGHPVSPRDADYRRSVCGRRVVASHGVVGQKRRFSAYDAARRLWRIQQTDHRESRDQHRNRLDASDHAGQPDGDRVRQPRDRPSVSAREGRAARICTVGSDQRGVVRHRCECRGQRFVQHDHPIGVIRERAGLGLSLSPDRSAIRFLRAHPRTVRIQTQACPHPLPILSS